MCLVVFGGTGYIGRATVLELAGRGHQVVVATRGSSGIGGKQSLQAAVVAGCGVIRRDRLRMRTFLNC